MEAEESLEELSVTVTRIVDHSPGDLVELDLIVDNISGLLHEIEPLLVRVIDSDEVVDVDLV